MKKIRDEIIIKRMNDVLIFISSSRRRLGEWMDRKERG